jgi:hypothetical protein
MKSLLRTVFLTLVLVPQPVNAVARDGRETGPPTPPTIQFSEDQQHVTIESQQGRWTLVRAVISPWD